MTTEEDRPEMEFKCVSLSGFKSLGAEEEGIVETFVSVTGVVDNVRDIIAPGAYAKSLETRTPKGVWHHSWKDSISKTLEIKELLPGDSELPSQLPNGNPWPNKAGALKVITQFNLGTQRGREAYSDVMFFGDQQEWSIGYNVPVGGATRDSKSGVRTINKLDLYEYSPVLFGAMPAARTASVKDAQLAYKSLMSPEEVDDVEEDDVEDDEVKSEFYPTDGGSDRVYGYMEDGMFTKAQVTVSSAQAKKIATAIASLVGLLRDTNVVDEDVVDDLEAEMEPNGGQQPAGGEEAAAGGEAEAAGSGQSMSEMMDEVSDDKELIATAQAFDEAVEAQDASALEEAADAILSAIEEAVEGGEDQATFGFIGKKLSEAMSAASEWEDGGEDDTEGEEGEEEEKSAVYDGEVETLSVTELKSLLN